MVSYFQFAISAIAILILAALLISGKDTAWKYILIPILAGVAIIGIAEGIKGLKGKQTFANS